MTTILVALDFSPASRNAFQYAARLAKELKASLTLVHVYSPQIIEPFVPIILQQALKDNKETQAIDVFAGFEKELPEDVQDAISLDFILKLGNPIQGILEACTETQPSLIVMGTKGGNNLVSKVIGSTTIGLIPKTKCPVLIIPEEATYQPIKNIAYASDFETEDTAALDFLLDFGKKLNSKLHCVHVRKNGSLKGEFKQDILKKAYQDDLVMENINFETLSYSEVVKGLNHYVELRNIDILVMLSMEHGLFARLFKKSQTQVMAEESKVPLWVFNANEFNPIKTLKHERD